MAVHRVRVEDGLAWASLLTDAERARAARFRAAADRDRYVAGHGAVRSLVGEALGREPAALVFDEGAHGKPFVVDDRALHFNLSHSGEWVLVAIARDVEVGVDVEHARADLDFLEIAPTVFTAAEMQALLALPPRRARPAFFRLWARKEAVLKAWGVGLSLEAREVHVGLGPHPRVVVRAPRDAYPEAWVEDVGVDADHFAAVASTGAADSVAQAVVL